MRLGQFHQRCVENDALRVAGVADPLDNAVLRCLTARRVKRASMVAESWPNCASERLPSGVPLSNAEL
jgi:hypothetical protein